MENGTHPPAPNGDLNILDAPAADTPRAGVFPALSNTARMLGIGGGLPAADPIASLLPPDIGDSASDTGSQRSSMQPRVPSRQLLQTALDLAQKAVEMDKGNDVAGALAAYREAVTKLRVVMERVGVDPTSDGKRGGGKNEDEGRTLRGIHDAYMARITLLSAYEGSDTEDGGVSSGIGNLTLDTGVNGSPSPAPDSPNGDAGPSTPMRSPAPSSNLSSKRKRKIQSKHSFGLDEEADLSGLDGVDESDEASIQEPFSSSRSASKSLPAVDASPSGSTETDDHPLPPLPAHKGAADGGITIGRSAASSIAASNGGGGDRFLVSPTTAQGTISQRRHRGGQSMSSISELNASPRGSVAESMDTASTRHRTMSTRGGYMNGDGSVPPVPPLQAVFRSTLAPPIRLQGSAHLTPRPEPQPTEVLHRPFHLMRILYASMDSSGPGAYLSSSLHIDPAVWKPSNWRAAGSSSKSGQPKLVGQEAKARALEVLVSNMEAIKAAAGLLLEGPREDRHGVDSSTRLSKAQVDQATAVGNELSTLLDALDDDLDATHKTLANKGVSVGAWKGKSKSGWGSRLSARVDKMSRGSDSPDRYIDLLSQWFVSAQILDEHLRCFTGPCTAAYHALPHKTYKQIETRLNRASQFVGTVVVPFVMDDFRLLMLGYLKGGMKYLEE